MIGYDHFTFSVPTQAVFGWGSVAQAGKLLIDCQAKKVLIITDNGVKQAGLLDKVLQSLNSSEIDTVIFDQVEPDPSVDTINAALALAKSEGVQALVAVGGGSSIDTAKGVSVLFHNGGDIRRFEGLNKVPQKGLYVMAIPTTAGTGSEVTVFAVITDLENERKFTIGSRYLAPDTALVDPELTLSLPPHLTASTGMDALTHAVEAYTSKISQPASDALALSAIGMIAKNLRTATLDQGNVLARNGMMKAQLLAGMAFNNALLGLSHAIASPLGAHFHIPHGLANAVMLPYVMEYNIPAAPDKYARIASALGVESCGSKLSMAYGGAAFVRSLVRDIGLPTCLKEVKGVDEGRLQAVAEDALKSGMFKMNVRVSSVSDVYEVLQKAYQGIPNVLEGLV